MKCTRLLLPFCALMLATSLSAQVISIASKDSSDGAPRTTGFVNLSIWFNGFVDFYGLQRSPTFNLTNIPIPRADSGVRYSTDLRQSRFMIGGTRRGTAVGPLTAYVEGDFYGPEGTTTFRLRHAYVKNAHWLIGQTWSTATDIQVLPFIADFDGPPTGIFTRSAMLRFKSDTAKRFIWTASLESPRTDIRFAGTGDSTLLDTTITPAYQRIPDFLTSIRWQWGGGHVELAAILRELRYRQGDDVSSEFGRGLVLAAVLNRGAKDHIYLQGLGGKGIGNYVIALGVTDADAIPFNGSLHPVPVYGGYGAYEHWWTDKWFSTGVLGGTIVTNDLIEDEADFMRGFYSSINLFVRPAPGLSLGTELLYGWRKDRFDDKGEAMRLYFVTAYRM
jgi:DcaP outer membrane protein